VFNRKLGDEEAVRDQFQNDIDGTVREIRFIHSVLREPLVEVYMFSFNKHAMS
jgi:hypothetical protein